MYKYKYNELMRCMSEELGKNSNWKEVVDKVVECLKYGYTKPYMRTKNFKQLVDKEIEKISAIDSEFKNSYIVKFHQFGNSSFGRMKYIIKKSIEECKKCLGEFEYLVWSKANGDRNFDICICFRFYNLRVTKSYLRKHFTQWFYCDFNEPEVVTVNSKMQIIEELLEMGCQTQENNVDFVWYPARTKLFIKSKHFDRCLQCEYKKREFVNEPKQKYYLVVR